MKNFFPNTQSEKIMKKEWNLMKIQHKNKLLSLLSLLLLFALTVAALAGCGFSGQKENDKIRIVTTVFPIYDWVRAVVGDLDGVEITMLLDSGVDLHSYQPSVEDIIKISTCDLFFYVGGESDEWVDDVLTDATNKDMVVVSLLDALGDAAKIEEIVEGMEHEHEHEEEHGEEQEEEHEEEYDEHIWLSLKNASRLTAVIAEKIGGVDSARAEDYRKNADTYCAKLSALDAEYAGAVAAASTKTLLFADRFPFRYLAEDYGLSYYAAFSGCSAETEASFETVLFLAKKVDELGLSAVMQIESANGRLAETVRDNTRSKDQKILTMDSLQSVTGRDVKDGADYLDVMRRNLEVLKAALG